MQLSKRRGCIVCILFQCMAMFSICNSQALEDRKGSQEYAQAGLTLNRDGRRQRTLLDSSPGIYQPKPISNFTDFSLAAANGETTGLNLEPQGFPATSIDGDAFFNRSSKATQYMETIYKDRNDWITFWSGRLLVNGTSLLPFTAEKRHLLFYGLFQPGVPYNWSQMALAANVSAPIYQVGAPYMRPGGVERPAGNNSIIIDAVLILPYAAFFSPVDAPFTTTQLKVSEGLSASLWASMGLDWQWTGSSVIVYGPPQFASILAKISMSSPLGVNIVKGDLVTGAITNTLNFLIDALLGAIGPAVDRILLVDVQAPYAVNRRLLPEAEASQNVTSSGHRRQLLAQQQGNAANVKLLFFFSDNTLSKSAAQELISQALIHPAFGTALAAKSFSKNVTLFGVANKFPFFDNTAEAGFGPAPSPGAAPVQTPTATPVPQAPAPEASMYASRGGGSNWAVGATVGIVVAGAALLMACVAFGLLVLRRRKRNRERSTDFETGFRSTALMELESKTKSTAGTSGSTSGMHKAYLPGGARTVSNSSTASNEQSMFADVIIDSQALTFPRDSLGLLKVIGKGSFGQVVVGMYAENRVAVKIMWTQREKQRLAFLKEAQILKQCRSSYIVLLLGVVFTDSKECLSPEAIEDEEVSKSPTVMMVMEFMQKKDLFYQLHESLDTTEFRWYKRGRGVAIHITRGLVYLHGNGIVHMDLKSQNVLINQGCQAKLADVGLAKVLREGCEQKRLSTVTHFTYQYSAPEILRGCSDISEKADVFSLGVVLWEICTGEAPYDGAAYHDVLTGSVSLRSIRVPEEGPQEICDLIHDCLLTDPAERPSASLCLKRLGSAAGLKDSTPSLTQSAP